MIQRTKLNLKKRGKNNESSDKEAVGKGISKIGESDEENKNKNIDPKKKETVIKNLIEAISKNQLIRYFNKWKNVPVTEEYETIGKRTKKTIIKKKIINLQKKTKSKDGKEEIKKETDSAKIQKEKEKVKFREEKSKLEKPEEKKITKRSPVGPAEEQKIVLNDKSEIKFYNPDFRREIF